MGWITVPEGIASVMFIHYLPPQNEVSNQKPYDIDVADQEQCMDTTVPFESTYCLTTQEVGNPNLDVKAACC